MSSCWGEPTWFHVVPNWCWWVCRYYLFVAYLFVPFFSLANAYAAGLTDQDNYRCWKYGEQPSVGGPVACRHLRLLICILSISADLLPAFQEYKRYRALLTAHGKVISMLLHDSVVPCTF